MNEEEKDKRFLRLLCVTALIGAANILPSGRFKFLLVYAACMVLGILQIYFSYSLSKWIIRSRSRLDERDPYEGEPSRYRLISSKISGWVLFGAGIFCSLASFVID